MRTESKLIICGAILIICFLLCFRQKISDCYLLLLEDVESLTNPPELKNLVLKQSQPSDIHFPTHNNVSNTLEVTINFHGLVYTETIQTKAYEYITCCIKGVHECKPFAPDKHAGKCKHYKEKIHFDWYSSNFKEYYYDNN